ncbi:DUF1016 domain-containing protein [Leucobacter coleopterorum]|uniref:DUF1016 domain-containing protein n=1 Tax=Leucobacter coleopterorum TaxID=2714933 RepID=A0ABX6JYZ8_9MICO|nr:PDDEXK nuclease domain-containing protein [Leucobacter coleopterorum]QIM19543.1 DUF1016 domain-containing protein [Leucobacter coleopterorum]
MSETGFPVVPGKGLMPNWYGGLLDEVSGRIQSGRQRAVHAVNSGLLLTYWEVGNAILERQSSEGWGAKVIDRLSTDLKQRFPEARGFSPTNLKNMRRLAETWSHEAIGQVPLAQLPWYHHLTLFKLKDSATRLWYANLAVEQGWSRDVLALQIESRLHEREGQAITNFRKTLSAADSDLAQQMTRDPYIFDFLGQTDLRRESELESGLVAHMSRFLLELGQGFAFVGQQQRLVIDGQEFFCDLLFYHVRLRRYVVIELKATEFKPEYLGQLGMYQVAVDDLLAGEHDEPTLGLLLCRTKSDTVAEYALRAQSTPTGVAEWQTKLTTELSAELAANLPSVEELEAELAVGFEGRGESNGNGWLDPDD